VVELMEWRNPEIVPISSYERELSLEGRAIVSLELKPLFKGKLCH